VVETVTAPPTGPDDVLVRVRAAALCHTDLEVIEGALHFPLPMILGHEAAGIVEEIGTKVSGVKPGDQVILSWNPHCGRCFQCDRGQPILCDTYIAEGRKGRNFDGTSKAALADGLPLNHLMFLGAFAEYCMVPAQQAVVVPRDIPLDRACLIGCSVMTGVGAALNVASIIHGDTVMVFGCGAVGLAAIQGARMASAGAIIAVDLSCDKLALAMKMGATHGVHAPIEDPVAAARAMTGGRGVDLVLEAAGHPDAFRQSVEAVRAGGEVVWLGKIAPERDVEFRWGALMGEKRLRRSSYGSARPHRDFPRLAKAYLHGRLMLDELVTDRIELDAINDGFDRLRAGSSIRTVVAL